ncbi:MAG: alpha/beta hydrolase [Candidatus Liberibacter ctenarytainae]|uniref:Alpha/beta hydrolase n=1 Tax=Candidatus Liberibacter ctenarytainae TaxID=2020335 RepID=A0A937AL39_9HYPH|nr:alpha/beta hydrolase [Candidatus Liberibacter ctenarytainae]
MMFHSWRNFQLAFVDEGDKLAPVILLLHGFTSSLKINWIFSGWIQFLCDQGFRVVALDNLGHGNSDKPHDPFDYKLVFMAADAASLLDFLGIGKAHVIGYSMGARIACSMAMFYPSYIDSLVLGGVGSGLYDPNVIDWDPIVKSFLCPSINDVQSPLGKKFRQFAENVPGNDLRALASCLAMTRALFDQEDLKHIDVPTLISVGSKDEIAGSPQELLSLMPHGQYLNIYHRDHMLAVGDKQFKQGVMDFYSRINHQPQ